MLFGRPGSVKFHALEIGTRRSWNVDQRSKRVSCECRQLLPFDASLQMLERSSQDDFLSRQVRSKRKRRTQASCAIRLEDLIELRRRVAAAPIREPVAIVNLCCLLDLVVQEVLKSGVGNLNERCRDVLVCATAYISNAVLGH